MTEKVTVGTRLKQIMLEQNLKQVDILNKTIPLQSKYNVRIAKNDLSQYVNDKVEPNQERIFILANALDVTEPWLMGFDVPRRKKTNLSDTAQAIVDVSVQLEMPRQHNVLTYAKTQLDEQNSVIKEDETLYISDYRQKVAVTEAVAAGRGFAYGDNEINYCYTDRADLPHFDIASYITGDSMEPEYHDGDVVLIRKEMYSNPGVYVVDYDGKSYLKKVYQEKDRFRLVSFNEKYDDIMIDLPLDDDVYLNIVGRVVGSFTPVER